MMGCFPPELSMQPVRKATRLDLMLEALLEVGELGFPDGTKNRGEFVSVMDFCNFQG